MDVIEDKSATSLLTAPLMVDVVSCGLETLSTNIPVLGSRARIAPGPPMAESPAPAFQG